MTTPHVIQQRVSLLAILRCAAALRQATPSPLLENLKGNSSRCCADVTKSRTNPGHKRKTDNHEKATDSLERTPRKADYSEQK